MRWNYRDPQLLWLFVPAYLAHLAEEYWAGAGLPAWFALLTGRPLPVRAFFMINAIALVILVIGLREAVRRESAGWFAVAIASLVSLNAMLHLSGTILTRTYSPGLISGIVLYVPLGMLTLMRAWQQQSIGRFWAGVGAGVLFHGVVSLVALIAART